MLKKPLTEIEITLTEKTMEALQALADRTDRTVDQVVNEILQNASE